MLPIPLTCRAPTVAVMKTNFDDVLLKASDDKSETITFVWEKIDFNFTTGGTEQPDLETLFFAYTLLMDSDWSDINLASQDLSGRDISRIDLSGSNLSNANLAGVNLSESILVDANLTGADLRGANLQHTVLVNFMGGSLEGADLTDANMEGMFGFFDLSGATLTNATCPDGSAADETGCVSVPLKFRHRWPRTCFSLTRPFASSSTPYTTEHALHGCPRIHPRREFRYDFLGPHHR